MSSKQNAAPNHASQGVRHVFVRDLEVQASIGIYDFEKVKPQRVIINIDLAVAEAGGSIDENIDNVVSYEHLVRNAESLVASGHIQLVETLAERIAASCLEDERVLAARVRVEKPDIFANARSVGIEIERRRG